MLGTVTSKAIDALSKMDENNSIERLNNRAFVIVEDNACYYQPDFSSAVCCIPPYGEQVQILDQDYDWVHLRWSYKEAWSVRMHLSNELTEKRENLYRDSIPIVFTAEMRRKRANRTLNKKLRERFELGYVDSEHFGRVMTLLKKVDKGDRLKDSEVMWLKTIADCWTSPLSKVWNKLEAIAFTKKWNEIGDAWAAVNASSHWREADEPDQALTVTANALAQIGKYPKLQTALMTTRGGALRDVKRLEEANVCGQDAHQLSPNDFRPCTLLGAVNFELGNFSAGMAWYKKAESLGAESGAVDSDLKTILHRAPKQLKNQIRAFLLQEDYVRFDPITRTQY